MANKRAEKMPHLSADIIRIERFVPFGLVLHGLLLSAFVHPDWHMWVPLGLVALCGGAGFVRRDCGNFCLHCRLVVLGLASAYLMAYSGGTDSFFLLWLYTMVAIYPLVVMPPYSYFVPVVAIGIYAGLIPFSDNGIPAVVLFSRLLLLGLIGCIVARVSASLWDHANLQVIANEDPLTGLFNRRYLNKIGDILCSRSARLGNSVSAIVVDLNEFKSINDIYGHDVGDAILFEVADCLRSQVRLHDVVARTGGDEFVVLLPDTDTTGAKELLERINCALSKRVVIREGSQISISASLGTATSIDTPDLNEVINEADRAMYECKAHARKVECSDKTVLLS